MGVSRWCPRAQPRPEPYCVLSAMPWHLAGRFRLTLELGLVTSVLGGICPARCCSVLLMNTSLAAPGGVCLPFFFAHFKGSAVTFPSTWLLFANSVSFPHSLFPSVCLGHHLLFAWGFFVLLLASVVLADKPPMNCLGASSVRSLQAGRAGLALLLAPSRSLLCSARSVDCHCAARGALLASLRKNERLATAAKSLPSGHLGLGHRDGLDGEPRMAGSGREGVAPRLRQSSFPRGPQAQPHQTLHS